MGGITGLVRKLVTSFGCYILLFQLVHERHPDFDTERSACDGGSVTNRSRSAKQHGRGGRVRSPRSVALYNPSHIQIYLG